ncbi:hypothetical protein [Myroides sp. TSA_177.3]|uniref:hypothetical protein n=1 Tax=Myroides sp. TSA_177.3 TaxID=3415650 RepID=UPI004045A983
MPNLEFKQLLVVSNTARSANQFQFKKLNLIKANNNSVGKSTLVKLLFWGLGCEPEFDTTWKSFDCSTIISFTINENEYEVQRYKNSISMKENKSISHYSKITGDFSEKFAEIVGFKALLPNQSTGELETPPPAYYFLPFYIDQKRSWSKAWDNFNNLGQYRSWKETIIKYHVGLLTPDYFEFEIEKSIKKNTKKSVTTEIEKIDSTLEVIEDFIPQEIITSLSYDDFDELKKEIEYDLKDLTIKQETAFDDYSKLQNFKSHLEHQKAIAVKLVEELDKDYVFAVENIESGSIDCPLCGTTYENTIMNKSSILVDKNQAERQLETIIKDINTTNKKIEKVILDLNKIKENIHQLNTKYYNDELNNQNDSNFLHLIENIGGNSIKRLVKASQDVKVLKVKELTAAIKLATKSQKQLYSKEFIEDIEYNFNRYLSEYIKILDATAVNLSEINSPLSYNKIVKEGGAAENSRAILAYYIAIYSLVEKYKNEVVSPLVIDTPNQQEQSDNNYSNIVKLIEEKISKNNQVIICAMSNPKLHSLEKNSHVIELNESKILDTKQYEEIKKVFDSWNTAIKNN